MPQQKPRRISFYLSLDEEKALSEVKAYYGTQSNSIAARLAIVEHAKQIREPQEREAVKR